MGKNNQLYKLRSSISVESQKIEFLLKHVIWHTDGTPETQVLTEIALEKILKISNMSEKIGKILKH